MAPLPDVSIEIVASRTDEIEPAGSFVESGTSIFGEGFTPELESLYRAPAVTGRLRNFHLTNVCLDAAAMMLIKGGCKLKETGSLPPRDGYDGCRVRADGLIRLPESVSHIHLHGFTDYYQWMARSLPAADWSIRNLPPGDFALLTSDLQPWQQQSLALLGHDRIPRTVIDPDHQYLIPSLDYCEFQAETADQGLSSVQGPSFNHGLSATVQATVRRLADAAIDAAPAVTDIVYVARTGAADRSLLNEADLISLLQAEGIAMVEVGSMSITEQINLFAKAEAIIGPHGAGLTNIMFCRPGTSVYELAPQRRPDPCFARLAQAGGLHYMIDLFGSIAETTDAHDRRWTADLHVVRGRVADIKQRVARLRPASGPATTALSGVETNQAARGKSAAAPALIAASAAPCIATPDFPTAMDYLKGQCDLPPAPGAGVPAAGLTPSRSWLSRLLAR